MNSSILWSLDNGYLNYSGQSIYLHSVNIQSLLFFKSALVKNQPGVLVYPSSRKTITPLLALEALYYRLHENKLPSGRNRLVIFSSRVELRRELRDHFTSFKAGGMPLYLNSFPIGRATANGKIEKIVSKTAEPRLIISPGIAALPKDDVAQNIFGVILEATPDVKEDQAEQILRWISFHKIPFIFIVSSDPPTELARKLIDKKFVYWGWNTESLAEDCEKDELNLETGVFNVDQPFCKNYKEIRNKGLGVKKIIIPVKEQNLNQILINLRKDYQELARASDSMNCASGTEVANRYLGCIYALEELTSPLAYAEIELGRRWGTIPVNRRISALRNNCESIRGEEPLFSSFAIRSSNNLLEAYRYMADKKTGKHPIIIQIIKEALANGKSVLFMSKNDAHNEALKSYLEIEKGMDINQLKQQRIDFVSVNALYRSSSDVNIVDTCILYGCPRYYQRDVLSYAKAKSIGIIAYESEIPAIKYIQNETDKVQNLFSDICKTDIAERLIGVRYARKTQKIKPEVKKSETELVIIDPQDAEMGDFTPKEIFSDFLSLDWRIDTEYANEAEARSADHRLGKECSEIITAAQISLPGNRYIKIHAEKLVQIYDESTEKIKDRLARNLKKGDLLILIENSTRKSLAESVIGKVESHPAMMEVVVYQKAWIHYLKQGLEESGDTFMDVIRKLQEHGARNPSTPAAIFHWVNGAIIGPKDLENIRRIGIIYDKPFLVAKFKEIANAVQRLRSIHRSLAVRLNKLIPQAGIEADRNDIGNTVIDEELDLYLEDFANIVSIERVESVEIVSNVLSGDLERVMFN